MSQLLPASALKVEKSEPSLRSSLGPSEIVILAVTLSFEILAEIGAGADSGFRYFDVPRGLSAQGVSSQT